MIDLKAVKEALSEILRMNDPRNLPTRKYRLEVFDKCRDALNALTAHLALSEYDMAVSDLAKYLPDGWYCFSSKEMEFVYFEDEPHLQEATMQYHPHWRSEISDDEPVFAMVAKVPHIDWRTSLRRIESGKVVTP